MFGADEAIVYEDYPSTVRVEIAGMVKDDLKHLLRFYRENSLATIKVEVIDSSTEEQIEIDEIDPEKLKNIQQFSPTKKTVSDVKEKYVEGEISILELESQLENVLDPEPIAVSDS